MVVKKKTTTKKVVKSKAKVTKKSPVKNITKKKTVTKKNVLKSKAKTSIKPKVVTKKLGKIEKPFTKTEIMSTIAEHVGMTRKQIAEIFDSLNEIITAHIKKGGPEKFILPGLLKIIVKNMPAKPARDGINPFTKEPMKFKAKPASKKVRVLPLKILKDMVH